MERIKQLIIPFSGLKEGVHHFKYQIGEEFFNQFEQSIIKSGNFQLKLELEKKVNMLTFLFDMEGEIYTLCDRCNSNLSLSVSSVENLIVKFGKEESLDTDEILILSPDEHEVDLTKNLYEYLNLLMPIKATHQKIEDCDQEVIQKLEEYAHQNESKKTDLRWAELEKLKRN